MTRRKATFADLAVKPRRTREVVLTVPDEESGGVVELVILLRSISAKAYDDLLSAHPPTAEQAKEGASYNPDTFAPALICRSSHDPMLSMDEAIELWKSEDWSRGELMELFLACVEVNSKGLDIPFT